jgi:hypothetical protein
VAEADQVIVRAEPDPGSEALLSIPKGEKVLVLEQAGNWTKVRIKLPDGFTFDGYVGSQFLKSTAPPSPPPPPTPVPVVPLPEWTPPPLRPAPSDVPPSPPPPRKRVFPREETEEKPRTSLGPGERFFINVAPAFFAYRYALSTGGATPGSIFSYNLNGPGFRLAAGGWLFGAMENRIRFGLTAAYGQAYLRFSTILKDSAGVEFDRRSAPSSLLEAGGAALVDYRISPDPHSIAFGLKIGYEVFRFKADDVTKLDGSPLGLYVGQTTKSVLAGLSAAIPAHPFSARVGIDLLLMNSVSESPANTTGIDPKGKFGYVPHLEIGYAISPYHHLKLGYRLRLQEIGFSGPGSRITPGNVTDGSVSTTLHQALLAYEFRL